MAWGMEMAASTFSQTTPNQLAVVYRAARIDLLILVVFLILSGATAVYYMLVWQYYGSFYGIPRPVLLEQQADPAITGSWYIVFVPVVFWLPLFLALGRGLKGDTLNLWPWFGASFVLSIIVIVAVVIGFAFYHEGLTPAKICLRSLWAVFYFSLVTMSTVGFGDQYPVTIEAQAWVAIQITLSAAVLIFLIGILLTTASLHLSQDLRGQISDLGQRVQKLENSNGDTPKPP